MALAGQGHAGPGQDRIFSPPEIDLLIMGATRPVAPVTAAEEVFAPRRPRRGVLASVHRVQHLFSTTRTEGFPAGAQESDGAGRCGALCIG